MGLTTRLNLPYPELSDRIDVAGDIRRLAERIDTLGTVGPQGDTGGQGPQGRDGPQGDAGGPQGAQGPQGATGPQGDAGPQGATGDTGSQGPQGTQGPQGPQGTQGPQGATGSAGATPAIFGGSGGSNLGASSTHYVGVGVTNTNEAVSQVPAPRSGTLGNLYVKLGNSPGTGKSYAFTVRVGGSDQTITITVSDSATTGSDTSHTVSVAAGDLICIKSAPTGTPTAVTMNWSMTYTS